MIGRATLPLTRQGHISHNFILSIGMGRNLNLVFAGSSSKPGSSAPAANKPSKVGFFGPGRAGETKTLMSFSCKISAGRLALPFLTLVDFNNLPPESKTQTIRSSSCSGFLSNSIGNSRVVILILLCFICEQLHGWLAEHLERCPRLVSMDFVLFGCQRHERTGESYY